MEISKLIAGIVLLGLGAIFFFNNKNIGKGSAKFYQWLYTEKNLVVIFKIVGIILIIGGLALIFLK
jgi:hypothetical protein